MELEWYQPGNVIVSGGLLHLVAREQAVKPKFRLQRSRIPAGSSFDFSTRLPWDVG
jgi:hypothetical protein